MSVPVAEDGCVGGLGWQWRVAAAVLEAVLTAPPSNLGSGTRHMPAWGDAH